MGLFGKKEPEPVQVAGLALHCEICKHDQFWQWKVGTPVIVMRRGSGQPPEARGPGRRSGSDGSPPRRRGCLAR